MRRSPLIAIALALGCGAAERAAPRATALLIVGDAPIEWTLGIGFLRPDGTVAGNWTRPGQADFDFVDDDAIVEATQVSPGVHQLVVAWLSDETPPQRIVVPLVLGAREAIVLVDMNRRSGMTEVQVQLIVHAPRVEMQVINPVELRFEIINGSNTTIRGIGFPSGVFDGDLVELWPVPRRVSRSRGYCGTGAFPQPPLAPGERTESGPSPWRMGLDSVVLPGDYLWIAQLSSEGCGERVREERIDGIEVRVARVCAAIAPFSVPEP